MITNFELYYTVNTFQLNFKIGENTMFIKNDIVDILYEETYENIIQNNISKKIIELISTIDSNIIFKNSSHIYKIEITNIENRNEVSAIKYIISSIYKSGSEFNFNYFIKKCSFSDLLKSYDDLIKNINQLKKRYPSTNRYNSLNYIEYIVNEVKQKPELINTYLIDKIVKNDEYAKSELDYLFNAKNFDII